MAAINDVARPEFVFIGSETDVLAGMLDHYRATLLMKCQDLDETQLARRSVLPSELTLLDLLRHLAEAERHWFQRVLLGRQLPQLYATTPDGGIDQNDPTPLEEVVQHFFTACEESRRSVAGRSFDVVVPSMNYETPVSLRFITVHMLAEYTRHCGHADLLREAIDGAVGE